MDNILMIVVVAAILVGLTVFARPLTNSVRL